MNNHIYIVYDIVAKNRVGQLMVFNRDEPAIRIFTDALADKQLTLGQHPADYELLKLAAIDDDKPEIYEFVNETVITGKQWLALIQKEQKPE